MCDKSSTDSDNPEAEEGMPTAVMFFEDALHQSIEDQDCKEGNDEFCSSETVEDHQATSSGNPEKKAASKDAMEDHQDTLSGDPEKERASKDINVDA